MDRDTRFLRALREADLRALPGWVTREQFEELRGRSDALAAVLEPVVTFRGKGYKHGYQCTVNAAGKQRGRSLRTYPRVCRVARWLLTGAEVVEQDWEDVDWGQWGEDDFVYLDPPYYETEIGTYSNINH
jgi:hypothetical protein